MSDYFALFEEPRRPWLDIGALKSKFLQLSHECHPDRFHAASPAENEAANRHYAELNAAYNCLRDPKERLLHLLILESGVKPKDVQRIPPGTMDFFMEVGQMCRGIDDFLAQKAKVASPLLKVKIFEQGMAWHDKLSALQQKIAAHKDKLLEELKSMNPAWEKRGNTSPPQPQELPLDRLEQVYRIMSYIHRWQEQLQEKDVQLTI